MSSATVWTPRRRWIGNLIPMALWLPAMGAAGTLAALRWDPWGWPLALALAGTAGAWLLANAFGLWQNAAMAQTLSALLAQRGLDTSSATFVGYASPGFVGTVDAHEDVGFLFVEPDRLRFVSETETVELARATVKAIRFAPNAHSPMLLGRWIVVEGEPVMRIEPRSHRTLRQNRKASAELRALLDLWRERGPTSA